MKFGLYSRQAGSYKELYYSKPKEALDGVFVDLAERPGVISLAQHRKKAEPTAIRPQTQAKLHRRQRAQIR
jgi:hypothetical protein